MKVNLKSRLTFPNVVRKIDCVLKKRNKIIEFYTMCSPMDEQLLIFYITKKEWPEVLVMVTFFFEILPMYHTKIKLLK